MEEIRCINRRNNKIQYYSADLVKNAHWRKQTQVEPAPLPTMEIASAIMPEPISAPSLPDELHAAPVKPKAKRGRKPKPTPA